TPTKRIVFSRHVLPDLVLAKAKPLAIGLARNTVQVSACDVEPTTALRNLQHFQRVAPHAGGDHGLDRLPGRHPHFVPYRKAEESHGRLDLGLERAELGRVLERGDEGASALTRAIQI